MVSVIPGRVVQDYVEHIAELARGREPVSSFPLSCQAELLLELLPWLALMMQCDL